MNEQTLESLRKKFPCEGCGGELQAECTCCYKGVNWPAAYDALEKLYIDTGKENERLKAELKMFKAEEPDDRCCGNCGHAKTNPKNLASVFCRCMPPDMVTILGRNTAVIQPMFPELEGRTPACSQWKPKLNVYKN